MFNTLTASPSFAQVISGHSLPKPIGSGAKGEVIDPYVVLELHGVPADCAEQRTRTAAQNQDDPLFDETFEFQVRTELFFTFKQSFLSSILSDPISHPHVPMHTHVAGYSSIYYPEVCSACSLLFQLVAASYENL